MCGLLLFLLRCLWNGPVMAQPVALVPGEYKYPPQAESLVVGAGGCVRACSTQLLCHHCWRGLVLAFVLRRKSWSHAV